MSQRPTEPVSLQRTQKPKRRFPWWIILVVLLLAAGGFAAYVFQGKISDAFKPAATLPPVPPGQSDGGESDILYENNFDDPSTTNDWEFFNDGMISSSVSNGQLVVGVNALSDTGTWSGLNFTFDSFVLDIDSSKLAGPDDNGIIVVFRLTDKNNYNRFDVTSDGYYSVSKVRDGVPTVVSDFNQSSAIVKGTGPNHITIKAEGDTFQFMVNGTVLKLCLSADPNSQPLWDPSTVDTCLGGQVTDTWANSDIPKGKIGLGAQAYVGFDGTNSTPAIASVAFDTVVVKKP